MGEEGDGATGQFAGVHVLGREAWCPGEQQGQRGLSGGRDKGRRCRESLEARPERLMTDFRYSFECSSKCDGMPLRGLDKRVI